ncbi:hypothetical protein [Candidatus Uabimicrobium sp. HlEnr_7]|uniref:hypothetical protein n=1 Tax=Candidatus Uabimicrobium helgolandensis TaxID=3095367 RepID=UPI0035580B7B
MEISILVFYGDYIVDEIKLQNFEENRFKKNFSKMNIDNMRIEMEHFSFLEKYLSPSTSWDFNEYQYYLTRGKVLL